MASATRGRALIKFDIHTEAVVRAARNSLRRIRLAGRLDRMRLPHPDPAHQPSQEAAMANAVKQLAEAGVAVWLDDLSRARIQSGELGSVEI